jgi:hypothetical protein
MTTTTEMTLTDRAVAELSEFNALIESVQPYADLTVAEDGIGKVEEAHKAVKRLNSAIEKKRKELKAGALEYGRTVDSIAKQLTSAVDRIEGKLGAEREAFEAVEKAQKAAKEAEKLAEKQKRIDAMQSAGISIDLAAAELPEDEWHWWFTTNKRKAEEIREHQERRAKLAIRIQRMEALGVAIGDAGRVGELSDEQFEHDYKIAKKYYDDERERQAEELRLRAANLEAERKAMEQERNELRKQQEELRQAQMREQAEKERREAELLEKRRAEERKRREDAARPEIEKLSVVVESLKAHSHRMLEQVGSPSWSGRFAVEIDRLAMVMEKHIREDQS